MFKHQNRVIDFKGRTKFDRHDPDNIPLRKEEEGPSINLLDGSKNSSVRSTVKVV